MNQDNYDFQNITVGEMLTKMGAAERDQLYFALLHMDEVGAICPGGQLQRLFDAVKDWGK